MSRLAIRLSMPAVCASALLVLPFFTPAEAASRHVHAKKQAMHWRHTAARLWYYGQQRPFVAPYAQSGDVCPGIGRSFDCKIWPPPIEDDPDRKTSKY